MNFNKVIERKSTNATKWNIKDGQLPLWIADMDFQVAYPIRKALSKRVKNGIYGYTDISDDFFKSYIKFYKERYDLKIEKQDMMFSLGVVPSISSTVRKLTNVGDNVVVLSPVYNIFYNSIVNNSRNVLEVELLKNGDDYSIDFENLEKAFKDEKTTLIIFCNPANPISKIWSKEDMIKLGKLAKENNVVVLSDEIHGFITRPNTKYTPFFSLNDTNKYNSVTCISVTKAFNLAGIHTSCILCPNKELYKKVNRQINTDEVAEPNVFSIVASNAALNESRDWLDKMREVVFENRDYVSNFINNNIPSLHVIKGDATYLLWIDCLRVEKDDKKLVEYLKEKTGLYLSSGSTYGKGGQGFLRMNVACPKSILNDALNRLKEGIGSYLK